MATTSLGRLTLDLLVRLGSFEQGLNRAERQASESANNMSDAFRGFGDQIRESLGGTQIGSIISDVTTRLEGMQGSVLTATAGLAGLAVGGTALAIGGLAVMSIEAAKADNEMAMLAARAKIGIENFQIFTYAAEQLGISQDQLGSIFADVQEKLGEFSATGGGGAADFFDALKNNTKLTDDQIKAFSKTLQGKDGIEAVQMLKDKLDDLGASSQEQRFVFESLASDLTNLMPLFSEGGAKVEEYGKALQDAGVIKSKEAIQQSQILAAQTQAVNLQFQGAKTQLVQGFMPAIVSVSDAMFGTSKNGVQLATVGDGLGTVFKTLATLALGTSHVIQQVGNAFGAVAAMAVAAAKRDFASVVAIYEDSEKRVDDINSDMLDRYSKVWGPVTESSNTLVNALQSISNATTDSSTGLKVNTKEAEENAKAKEAQAKAIAKANKELQVNALVQSNAKKFGFADLESQYKLPQGLLSAINMQESRGKSSAVGPQTKYGTAKGGFQFLDGTAKRFGLLGDDVFNTGKSAEAAAKYFNVLYEKFGTWEKAISAYHAGEGNVERGTGLGPINREYVKNVLGYMDATLKGVGTTAQDAISYVDDALNKQLAIVSKYATEEQKMALDNQEAIKAIKLAYAEGDPSRQKYLDLQQGIYDRDVSAYKQAQQEKYDSYRNDFLSKMADAEDAISLSSIANKYGKGGLEFQVASLNVSARKSKAGEYDDYTNTVNQINRDYNTPELETQRYKLLEDAKAAHIAALKAMDVEYHDSAKQLVEDQQKSTLSMYGSLLNQASGVWSDMTNMVKQSSGEQSRAYRAMFLMQQMFAIGSALISTHLAAAQVMADPSALTLAQKAMYSKLILAMGYANVGLIAGQTIAGVFHGGEDYVPKEASYLLDKGERVLSPRQNTDLTRYLNDRQGGDGVNVNINVPPGYTANESRDANGNVTIDVVEKMIKKSWTNVGQPNSFESKQVQRNFNTSVKR